MVCQTVFFHKKNVYLLVTSMTFDPATYLCAVCVYLQGFEEFFKYLEFLHQLTNAYTKTYAFCLW